MYAERVSVKEGTLPIILLAPHGCNDANTDIIVDTAADKLDCYAVINNGWERSSTVDASQDKANCNNISHCHEDVVKDEFLDPILRYSNRCSRTVNVGRGSLFMRKVIMLSIHGCGDDARVQAGDRNLDFIFGFGLGKKIDLAVVDHALGR